MLLLLSLGLVSEILFFQLLGSLLVSDLLQQCLRVVVSDRVHGIRRCIFLECVQAGFFTPSDSSLVLTSPAAAILAVGAMGIQEVVDICTTDAQ